MSSSAWPRTAPSTQPTWRRGRSCTCCCASPASTTATAPCGAGAGPGYAMHRRAVGLECPCETGDMYGLLLGGGVDPAAGISTLVSGEDAGQPPHTNLHVLWCGVLDGALLNADCPGWQVWGLLQRTNPRHLCEQLECPCFSLAKLTDRQLSHRHFTGHTEIHVLQLQSARIRQMTPACVRRHAVGDVPEQEPRFGSYLAGHCSPLQVPPGQ